MINVIVEGFGKFQIKRESVGELLNWLSKNNGVRINEQNTVREVKDNNFTGRELIED